MIFKSHPVAFTQGTHFASGWNALLLKPLPACAAPDFEFPDFDENSRVGVSDARRGERPGALVVSTLLAP